MPPIVGADDKPGGRYLIALGVSDPGEGARLPVLPMVDRDLERVRGLLVKDQSYEAVILGHDAVTGAPNANLTAEQIRIGLITWRQKLKDASIESLVFYFSGHGIVSNGELYLCTRGFLHAGAASGLSARDLGSCLEFVALKTWVILDVCYAGAGAKAIARDAMGEMGTKQHTLWFLASSGGRSPSQDGNLSRALDAAVQEAPRAYDELVRKIQAHLKDQHAESFVLGNGEFDLLRPISAETARHLRWQRRMWLAERHRAHVSVAILSVALVWMMARDPRPLGEQLGAMARSNNALVHSILTWFSDAFRPTGRSPSQQPQTSEAPDPPPPSLPATPATQERDQAEPAERHHAPPEPNTAMRVKVLAQPNDRPVTVSDEHPLRGGDRFNFYVTLPEPGYVGVIHIARDGEMALIYPRSGEQHVSAAVLTPVPAKGSFEVDAKPAVERFVVFASSTPTQALPLRSVLQQVRNATHWPWSLAAPPMTFGGPWVRTRASFVVPAADGEQRTGVYAATLLEIGHLETNPF